MKKNSNGRIIILMAVFGVFASCSQEIVDNVIDDNNKDTESTKDLTSLRATLVDFNAVTMADEFPAKASAPLTRSTIIEESENNYQLVWAETDTIGIFPSTGMQVAFPMASSAGTKSASFDGGGWGLKTNATYSAYYPLIGQFYLDRTKIPMIISTQVQNGNGSNAHIGKYDYMAAVNSVVNEQGGVDFNFNHLVSILHMQIKMPKGGNYSYVAVETSGKFTTEATINLSDGTVTPTKQSPIQIMRLENVELDNNEEDPILEVWMVIHPVDLSDKMLYTKVYDEDNNCYTTTMQAMNFEGGTIYNSRKIAREDLTHTGLPVTIINTPGNVDITSKEEYVEDALMTILQTDISDAFCELMNTKGRGNSTWSAPKKPYAIKFNKKKSLLSLPDDKSWVLLANYFDPTLLRNSVALYMGNEISTLDWTPHYHYTDLMLNGQYKGIYQLGEKVKISKGRVNVGDDGFLMEIDKRALVEDDARYFTVSHLAQPVNIKDPEVEYNDEDYNYAKEYVQTAESVLYGENFTDPDDGWQKYMDINSFVDWYIVNEFSKNTDACTLYSSCYMNLKRKKKKKMGPLWDFDLAFGGYPESFDATTSLIANNPNGFWLSSNGWFSRLFEDPAFVAKVKERFNIFYEKRTDIINYIDEKASILKDKISEENKLWGQIADTSTGEDDVKALYQEKTDALKTWIEARFAWMYANINSL